MAIFSCICSAVCLYVVVTTHVVSIVFAPKFLILLRLSLGSPYPPHLILTSYVGELSCFLV